MPASEHKRAERAEVLREIANLFDALADEIDRALQLLPTQDAEEPERKRLLWARATALKGAELAKAQLRQSSR